MSLVDFIVESSIRIREPLDPAAGATSTLNRMLQQVSLVDFIVKSSVNDREPPDHAAGGTSALFIDYSSRCH